MRFGLWLSLLAAMAPAVVPAAAAAEAEHAPARARLTIVLDKPEYLLGENVLIHYCLQNTGTAPFSIDMGGDYRGASRHLRFKVTVTGPDGRAVPDPDPSGFNMGGVGWSPTLKPGERYWQSLPLARYALLTKPGTYTLTVRHDLGWEGHAGRAAPSGTAKLTLRTPTPAEAARVVAAMARLSADPGAQVGKRSRQYADYTALRHPAYLPILRTRAARGDRGALTGIGSIETPEATRALVRLLSHPDPQFALEVARALNARLPDPHLQGELPPRNPFFNEQIPQRQRVVRAAWRAELAPAIRAHARKLLAGGVQERAECGAFMLECVGRSEDLPAVVSALDREIRRAATRPLETGVYPRPRGACAELMRAAEMLLRRGAEPPERPGTPGESVVFLRALGTRRSFRPNRWEATLRRLVRDRNVYVRETALKNTPLPVPPPVLQLLPERILDADVDVQIAACELAEKTRAASLLTPVLQALGRAKEEWLLRAASSAAVALGGRYAMLETWARRMDEPGMVVPAIEQLLSAVKYSGGYGYDGEVEPSAGPLLKSRWSLFLQAHEAELRAGQKFASKDARLEGLFPRQFKFQGEGEPSQRDGNERDGTG